MNVKVVNTLTYGRTLDELKADKKAELSQACNAAITSGFTSTALGVEHTYPCDDEAQRNFHTELFRFLVDPTYTKSYFKTIDAGYLPHTKDQLIQVFKDGHIEGFSNISKLNQLKADVDSVTDTTTTTTTTTPVTAEDQLDKIGW